MNMIYVTFTHGLAFPVLFPIALFGIFNMYLLERLLMAYYYRQPPMLDGRLDTWSLYFL